MRIGINGFGRIGRLVFRALWGRPGIDIVHVNDCAGDAAAAAHLLHFDSVHGRWQYEVRPDSSGFLIGDQEVQYSTESDPAKAGWSDSGVEMLLECSGKFKSSELLQSFLNILDHFFCELFYLSQLIRHTDGGFANIELFREQKKYFWTRPKLQRAQPLF